MPQSVEVELVSPILIDEELYFRALIDLDHINYGLNSKTKKLNLKQRTIFSTSDICLFLNQIDGIEGAPVEVLGSISYFLYEVMCPIVGLHFGKRFRLIFQTDKDKPGLVTTITLYRCNK